MDKFLIIIIIAALIAACTFVILTNLFLIPAIVAQFISTFCWLVAMFRLLIAYT